MRSLPFVVLGLSTLLLCAPAEARSALVGKKAPEISLSGGVHGVSSRTTMAAQKGHPVLVVFWNPG